MPPTFRSHRLLRRHSQHDDFSDEKIQSWDGKTEEEGGKVWGGRHEFVELLEATALIIFHLINCI